MTIGRNHKPNTLARAEQVLEMCLAGQTLSEIARELCVPQSTARGWIDVSIHD